MQPLIIDEQTDKLSLAQTLLIMSLEALFEGLGQGGELHSVEFVESFFK